MLPRRWPMGVPAPSGISHEQVPLTELLCLVGFLVGLWVALASVSIWSHSDSRSELIFLLAIGSGMAVTCGAACLVLRSRRLRGQRRGVPSWRGRSAPSVSSPPGSRLRHCCDLIFSKRTCSEVLIPTVRDLQDEYFEALHQGRRGKARWVVIRGYWSFWSAVVAQVPVSLTRLIVKLWKVSGPGG